MRSRRVPQFQSKSFRFRFSEEFRGFQNFVRDLNVLGTVKLEKKFCFALRLCIYKILVALQARLTLTILQRLNEAYPDRSFHSFVVCRGTNPPRRTGRLRSVVTAAV